MTETEALFRKLMAVGEGCTCDECVETGIIILNAAICTERECATQAERKRFGEVTSRLVGKYLVDDCGWEETPRWRQFFGARPFRQWHHVHGTSADPGYYTYANTIETYPKPSTGEEQ